KLSVSIRSITVSQALAGDTRGVLWEKCVVANHADVDVAFSTNIGSIAIRTLRNHFDVPHAQFWATVNSIAHHAFGICSSFRFGLTWGLRPVPKCVFPSLSHNFPK